MKNNYIISSLLLILAVFLFLLSCSQISQAKNTKQEIQAFYDKVRELNNFCIEIDSLEKKYNLATKDARENFNKSELHSQQTAFAAILRDNYKLWYEELSQLQVCPCMQEAFGHYISCIHFKETAMCCHLEKDQWGFDMANLKDSVEYNRTKKEILKIMKELNSIAEKLDLALPYPEYAIDPTRITGSGA